MRISWLSNAPWSFTGYGNQTKVFVPRLQKAGHEMAITAFYGHEGTPINLNGVMVYGKAHHLYGQDIMCAHAKHFGADIMISLMDAWVVDTDLMRHGVRWVPWFPVDSEPLSPRIIEQVEKAYKRIVFSKFGERIVNEAGLDCYYIPHGIDTNVFRPTDKEKAREVLGWPNDRFIFGMVAANKGNPSRKAFQQHLEAFAMFLKKHDDALLYLHTTKCENGEFGGVNLPEFARYLGVQENIIYSDDYINMLGFPDEYMVSAYNAMDVHILVSMGEGFGIPTVEAQACGTPVITSGWTASEELCFGGWTVDKKDSMPMWNALGTYQYAPRSEAILEKMELAYKYANRDHYREQARKGALAYDADLVTEKYWLPVLEEIDAGIEHEAQRVQCDHKWAQIGLWNTDGSMSVPCEKCDDELVINKKGVRHIRANGFKIGDGLKFVQSDGVEKIVYREIKSTYDIDLDYKPGDYVVDIGAHQGVVSIYLAKKYPFLEIEAWEPNRQNLDKLSENGSLNGNPENIVINHKAVTANGRNVVISTNPQNSGGGNIYDGEGEEVWSTPFSEIASRKIRLLKIDCEGAEYEILRSAPLDNIQSIRGELHPMPGENPAEFLKWLQSQVPDTKMTVLNA